MIKLFTASLCLLASLAFGQDTTYYNHDWEIVKSPTQARFFEVAQVEAADTADAMVKTYFISGQLKLEMHYSNYRYRVLKGNLREFYENGQLRKDVNYLDGKLHGKVLTYWDNGALKRDDAFENGKFIEGKCLNSDGTESTHYAYQILPEFPGGVNRMVQFIATETKYPQRARKQEVTGLVVVKFIVNKSGDLANIEIDKSVSPDLDKEALRVVKKMPKWTAGVVDGEAVKTEYFAPFRFSIQ